MVKFVMDTYKLPANEVRPEIKNAKVRRKRKKKKKKKISSACPCSP